MRATRIRRYNPTFDARLRAARPVSEEDVGPMARRLGLPLLRDLQHQLRLSVREYTNVEVSAAPRIAKSLRAALNLTALREALAATVPQWVRLSASSQQMANPRLSHAVRCRSVLLSDEGWRLEEAGASAASLAAAAAAATAAAANAAVVRSNAVPPALAATHPRMGPRRAASGGNGGGGSSNRTLRHSRHIGAEGGSNGTLRDLWLGYAGRNFMNKWCERFFAPPPCREPLCDVACILLARGSASQVGVLTLTPTLTPTRTQPSP